MMKVSIIGLGWLGLPLAQTLISRGYEVLGTKTTDDGVLAAQRCGIEAFPLQMTPDIQCEANDLESLLTVDVLIITLPASRTVTESGAYLQVIQNLVDSAIAQGVQRVLFTSSTSVYGEVEGVVNETTPLSPVTSAAQSLYHVEQWLHSLPNIDIDILRLAGLVGPDRHPGRFLAGRTGLSHGSQCVNLVHQQDVISAILLLLDNPSANRVFNLCAARHPRRDEFYPQVAKQLGVAEPQFLPDSRGASGKRVDGEAICRQLGFKYHYQDPLRMPA